MNFKKDTLWYFIVALLTTLILLSVITRGNCEEKIAPVTFSMDETKWYAAGSLINIIKVETELAIINSPINTQEDGDNIINAATRIMSMMEDQRVAMGRNLPCKVMILMTEGKDAEYLYVKRIDNGAEFWTLKRFVSYEGSKIRMFLQKPIEQMKE